MTRKQKRIIRHYTNIVVDAITLISSIYVLYFVAWFLG